jgi:archaellum biogenesis ATPase FlaH
LIDSIDSDGNFLVSSLINSYLKNKNKVVFVAFKNNYAHYLNVSKKLGFSIEMNIKNDNLVYIDAFE